MSTFTWRVYLLPILISILYYVFLYDHPILYPIQNMGSLKTYSPSLTYPFGGRFYGPLLKIPITPTLLQQYIQYKQWIFISINTPSYFIGFAIANLGYLTTAFCYLVDKKTGNKTEYSTITPINMGLQYFHDSPIDGCTSFRSSNSILNICYIKEFNKYHATMLIMKENNTIQFTAGIHFFISKAGGFSLLYPLSEDRKSYSFKDSAMKGNLKLMQKVNNSGREIDEMNDEKGYASIDFTKSLSNRVTKWKWVSFSCEATFKNEKVDFGLNLSDYIYNDVNGLSQENMIWLNDTLIIVNKVDIDDSNNIWKITSTDSPFFNLTFEPSGKREEHVNYGILISDFVQPYGKFKGTIKVEINGNIENIIIHDAYGVVENHYSKW